MVDSRAQTPLLSEVCDDDMGDDPISTVLTFEEALRVEPTSLSTWLKYISHLKKESTDQGAPVSKLFSTFERAVAALPGNYKVWREYAREFRSFALAHHPLHASRAAARSVSKRAAQAVSSNEILWAELLQHQLADKCLADIRNTLNSALRAVPITQHDQIWAVILAHYPWKDAPLPFAHLLRRYAKFAPDEAPLPLAHALVAALRIDDALNVLRHALADTSWAPRDMSRQEVFLLFIKTAAKHATSVRSTPVFDVVHTAVQEPGASIGELWATLAQFYIRRSDFAKARSVLERAISTVTVVRDFAVAFDAYTKLEESLTEVLAVRLEKQRGKRQEQQLEREIALQLTRLEYLVDRRPMLLSDVHLRQNVHNVHEWHKRMRMLKATGGHAAIVDGYLCAIRTVSADKATHGRKHTLWLAFAHFYEQSGDLASARRTLEDALADEASFRTPEDVAAVWCDFAEMELRAGDLIKATKVLRRALSFESRADPSLRFSTEDEKPTVAVKRSRRLWLFLLDMLQSTDNVDDMTAVHTRMLDARVATPSSILHGAAYLEDRRLFERAFRLYDRATAALAWPEAVQIWVIYLSKFVERYGSKRVERARDLFEEAIRAAPVTKSSGVAIPHPQVKVLYVMYAEMEERFSMGRHALAVLERAARAVREEDRAEVYRLYVVKTATLLGASRTRAVYVEALQSMRDLEAVVEFAYRFSAMERRLGEIDRARAIYVECCRVVDTRVGGNFARFWKEWEDFEADVGNEDDVRNMLRWKRRVQLDHQNVLLDQHSLNGGGITNMVKGEEIGGASDVDSGNENGSNPAEVEKDGDAAPDSTCEVYEDTGDVDGDGEPEVESPEKEANVKTAENGTAEFGHGTGFVRQLHSEASAEQLTIEKPIDLRDVQGQVQANVQANEAAMPEIETTSLPAGVKRLLATAYQNTERTDNNFVADDDTAPQPKKQAVETSVAVKERRKRRWDVEAM